MGKNHVPVVNLKTTDRGKFEVSLQLLTPGIITKIWVPPHLCGRNPTHDPGMVVACTFVNMEFLTFDTGVQFQRDFMHVGTQGSMEKYPLLYCWHEAEVKGFLFQHYESAQYGKPKRKCVTLIGIASFQAIASARSKGLIVGPRLDWQG